MTGCGVSPCRALAHQARREHNVAELRRLERLEPQDDDDGYTITLRIPIDRDPWLLMRVAQEYKRL